MIFHVSNPNTRVLDPPTHSHQFDTNCGKIWHASDPYVRPVCFRPKTNRPRFCVPNINENFLMHWMACSGCYLGCVVVNINALFPTTFRYCCLVFFRVWIPLFIFGYRSCDGHFPCFSKYIFPQLQTCSDDCTEGSCWSNT